MNRQAIVMSAIVGSISIASAKDITAHVKSNTDFDERVAAACHNKCGNRGSSTLDAIIVTPANHGRYTVVAKATARYHEDRVAPLMASLLGQSNGIQYVIKVTAHGHINAADCKLIVEKVDVIGDELGLADAFLQQQGSQYYLKGCRAYL